MGVGEDVPAAQVDRQAGDVPTALALVALTSVVVIECARAIFSVTYKVGEDIGFLVAGLVVVTLFVAPVLAPLAQRLVPSRPLLVGAVAVLAAGRVGLQFMDQPTFVAVTALLAVGLVTLTLVVTAVRARVHAGSLVTAIGVTVGLGLDTALRATGITWDTVWRDDLAARGLTIALCVGLVAVAVRAAGAGLLPGGEDRHAALPAFLVWPYLYLALFYVQSTAYVDSSAGSNVAVGLAVALGNAALAVTVLVVTARRPPPRPLVVALALVLAGLAWLLTGVTGPMAIVVCVAAQAAAAALYGTTLAAAPEPPWSAGIGRTTGAFVGGGLLFAIATLAYTIHPLQPLPVTNRIVPALVALSMLLAVLARPARTPEASTATAAANEAATRPAWLLAGGLAALALIVPLLVTATWPSPTTATTAGRPLRVMTFNIDEGVANGPLDLEEVARTIEAAQPDVVVIEELGRGWAISGMTDEAEWLRRRLGMAYGWAPANDNQFGNIVLSSLPILDSEAFTLQKLDGRQTRSAVFLTVDPGEGEPIHIIGAHLENGDEPQYHEARAQAYRDIIDRWGGAPRTVFLGDFNTYPRLVSVGWPELNIPLDAGFTTTQDTLQCTMPTSNENCPDWIFVSPDGEQSPVSITVDRADHRPIIATVTFPDR